MVDTLAGIRLGPVLGPASLTGADPVLLRIAAQQPPPVAPDAAEIRWGKASNLEAVTPTLTVIFPDDSDTPDDPSQQEPPPFQYEETWRQVSKIKVANPDDADQYVMVERVEKIIFRGEDGRRIQLNFHNDPGEGTAA
jgi:hypothetical protein